MDKNLEFFRNIVLAGWQSRVVVNGKNLYVYQERLKMEIEVITKLKLVNYFLIVYDALEWCRKNNILIGVGRGSSSGSLVCYLMGITQLDPIEHGLFFERFLNVNRADMADIDIDVQDDRRAELFAYLRRKYGYDKTSQIGTFGYLSIVSAFRDVCSVMNIPSFQINELSKMIVDESSFEEIPELRAFARDHPRIVEHAKKLNGVIRNVGTHAAGLVISSHPINEVAVIEHRKDSEVCNWDKKTAEAFGLLKMDFLGLSTLTVLNRAKGLIKEIKGVDIDLYNIPLDDEKTIAEFQAGNSVGIFQFEKGFVQQVLRETQPKTLDHLAQITALCRPGPMMALVDESTTMLQQYVRVASGKTRPYFEHELLQPILYPTMGVLIYQEQVMQVFQKLANFSLAEADEMRKIIGRKMDAEAFEPYKDKFVKGCIANNIDGKFAAHLFEEIKKFAGYGFNRCFAGSSIINRERNGGWVPTIKEMYLCMNDRNWALRNKHIDLYKKYRHFGYGCGYSLIGGFVKKNKIVDIRYEGFREVFRVSTADGKFVDVTSNHKFPTTRGIYSIDSGLSVGDKLFKKGKRNIKNYSYSFSDGGVVRGFGASYSGMGFRSGVENVGYVNGEYSKFETNRAILFGNAEGKCQWCGVDCNRLECHHIDGNRRNNSIENLVVICPSCHKKDHYKLSRCKKGDHGYVVDEIEITSIEYIGKEDVYDVEMDAPNHTVLVNGLIACNSHASSYAYNSFSSMYLKVHYPVEYMASLLSFTTKKANIPLYIRECDRLGIEVLMPDINLSSDEFAVCDGKIIAPLGAIKGIGDAVVKDILMARGDVRFSSLEDIESRVTKRVVNKAKIDVLFRSNALRSIGIGETDPDIKHQNMCELLDIFNKLPSFDYDNKIEKDILNVVLSKAECCSKEQSLLFMQPVHGVHAPIMVISKPTKGETEHLTNSYTKHIVKCLGDVGVSKSKIYYTGGYKCQANNPKGEFNQYCQETCPEFLREEIVAIRPKVIILCDNRFQGMFINPKLKWHEVIGNIYYVKKFGCYVIPSHTPQRAAFVQDEKIQEEFAEVCEKISQIFA